MSYQSELLQLGIDTKGKFSGIIKTTCPRCAHTRKKQSDPSLSVNIDEGVYKCHHCQWKGSVVGAKPKYNVPTSVTKPVNDKIKTYFENRGISQETVNTFKVTQSEEMMPQDGKTHLTICFNYYEYDNLVNIKYKTSSKMFKMVTGAKKIPYNLNAIMGSSQIIICEGEEETMVWHEAGFPFAVSCPSGANTGNNNLEWLDNAYQHFENAKIYLATDNDAPGRKLRDDLARRFEPENVFIIEFKDTKDANDALKEFGKEYLVNLFNAARPLPIPEIASISDFEEELNNIYDSGYPTGDKLDLPELDELITWKRGQFVVATGIPGSGKSTFVDQVCIRLACRRNWKFGMFSPENDNRLKTIRMSEQIVGRPLHGSNRMSKEHFQRALQTINDKFFFYDTVSLDDFKIENLLRIGKYLVRTRGVDCLVFDPFNYIENDSKDELQNEKIGKMLVRLKKFALSHNVLVILIAHPRKMQKDKQSGEYEIPRLYDISGSHHFFNVTDNGFAVHRNYQTGQVDVYVQKIKHYFMGRLGSVTLDFDVLSGRYKEMDQNWSNELDYNKSEEFSNW